MQHPPGFDEPHAQETTSLNRFAEAFLKHKGNLSDKWEQYLAIYDAEFDRFIKAGRPVRLLEIGVQNGGSLQVWRDFLPQGSRIVGIDIDPACADLSLGEGIDVLIGDASNAESLDALLGDGRFNIIIDDGSHRSDHIIATFKACFGRLEEGGLFIVEDLHCSYFASHGGGMRKRGAAIEWFKSLIDGINSDYFSEDASLAVEPAELDWLKRIGRSLARISFYDSVVVAERAFDQREEPYRRVLTGDKTPAVDFASLMFRMPPTQLGSLLLSPAAATSFEPALRARIAAAQEVTEALQGQINALQGQLSAREGQLIALQGELHARQGELETHRLATEAMRQETAMLRRAESSLLDKIDENRAELAKLLSEVKILREAEAGARKAEAEARSAETQARRAEAEARHNASMTEAALQEALSRALAAEAHLQIILNSTLWQMTRRLTPVLRKMPSPARRLMRRGARGVSWALKGELLQRIRQRGAPGPAPGAPALTPPALPQERPHVLPPETHPDIAGGVHHEIAPETPCDRPGETSGAPPAGGLHDQPPQTPRDVPPDTPLDIPYAEWCAAHAVTRGAALVQRRMGQNLSAAPTFSILVPVFRTPLDVFEALVASVQEQTYEAWELCLAVVDTGDDGKALIQRANAAAANDARIKVAILGENRGISANTNRALAIATGDWAVLLDHDDLLSIDALYELARAISNTPDAALIYSDKDQIDRTGSRRLKPFFKPAWSPDIMLSANYLTHVSAVRVDRLREIGGWDPETDGAQDWDVFLRAIGQGGRVVHIPRVLYHWRQIETSVSVGGLDAKPYAAKGQLRTLEKHLPEAGWPGAKPVFEGPYIRLKWGDAWRPAVSVVIVGGRPSPEHLAARRYGGVEVLEARDPDPGVAVDKALSHATGEVAVLVNSTFIPADNDWLEEMVQPLSNPAIALVGGRVIDPMGRIVDFGVVFQDGAPFPAFRDESSEYFGALCSCGWYRNAAAASGGALAFRLSLWKELGSFAPGGEPRPRADLQFCLDVMRRGLGRLFLNPFAKFRTSVGVPSWFEIAARGETVPRRLVLAALPDGDPFVNPNLDAARSSGAPALRLSRAPRAPHDFAAEAGYVAATYDATSQDIAASVAACAAEPAGPLKRMLWVVPDFEVPFYGGIHTILRVAEHLRTQAGVEPVFAVHGADDPGLVSHRIARAFPGLAATAQVVALKDQELPALGRFDAAICTLWVTAYPLLKMRDVRRKFYFVQDWEPSFYPAGTLSSAVEATYRFGFHAVCNTPSLAEAYAALGGRSDFFLPAVDSAIFHARGRPRRRPGDPFVLACYARPGTPRNCFEAISEGLRMLKQRHGDRIEIVSAGADWDVAQFGLDKIVSNLGLLDYARTGALYRSVDAGLVAMATRHPSYLPFELMACGAAVVSNRNAHTGWLLKDGENSLLCEMNRSDIAYTVSRLIEDPELRDALAERALRRIEADHSDWNAALAQIHAIFRRVVET